MDNWSTLTILFVNIQTLSPPKLVTVESLLEQGYYDVVLLAETRHQCLDLLDLSPFFLQHSDRFLSAPCTIGGVALLAHHRWHRYLTCRPALDAVCFRLGTLSFAGVYLAPSLLAHSAVPERLSSLVGFWPGVAQRSPSQVISWCDQYWPFAQS